MKIDELIEELNKFKKKYGNLKVGIARINSAESAYEDVAYYSDIVVFKVKDSYLLDNNDDFESTEPFCALG